MNEANAKTKISTPTRSNRYYQYQQRHQSNQSHHHTSNHTNNNNHSNSIPATPESSLSISSSTKSRTPKMSTSNSATFATDATSTTATAKTRSGMSTSTSTSKYSHSSRLESEYFPRRTRPPYFKYNNNNNNRNRNFSFSRGGIGGGSSSLSSSLSPSSSPSQLSSPSILSRRNSHNGPLITPKKGTNKILSSSPLFKRRHTNTGMGHGIGHGIGNSSAASGDGNGNSNAANGGPGTYNNGPNHLETNTSNDGGGGGGGMMQKVNSIKNILSVSSLVSVASGDGNNNSNKHGHHHHNHNTTSNINGSSDHHHQYSTNKNNDPVLIGMGGHKHCSISITSTTNINHDNKNQNTSTVTMTHHHSDGSPNHNKHKHSNQSSSSTPSSLLPSSSTTTPAGAIASIHNRPKTTFINCPARIHTSLDFILNHYSTNGRMTCTSRGMSGVGGGGDGNISGNYAYNNTNGNTSQYSNNLTTATMTTTTTTSNTNTGGTTTTTTRVLTTPLEGSSGNNGKSSSIDHYANTEPFHVQGHKRNTNNNSSSNSSSSNYNSVNANRNGNDNSNMTNDNNHNTVIPTWRLKERMKTVGVGLILALNIGTDPPDVHKPNPCAKLICWMDPTSTSRAKAREKIGEKLENQYAKWQGQSRAKLKYKRASDPTVEDVRNLCFSMRRVARNERLLLHYNGHGVPRPTANGEIWVFDRNHRQYIPLAVSDLRKWIGKPSLIVLDCSGAGALLPFLTNSYNTGGVAGAGMMNSNHEGSQFPNGGMGGGMNSYGMNLSGHDETIGPNMSTQETRKNVTEDKEAAYAAETVRDYIVLCPTSASENLPMNPELPADLFTSCLTTPIPIALRWFVHQNPLSSFVIDPNDVDLIPGKLSDRKTPLGELNWIFTAITDNIAWNVLPSALFQRLFRQDLLVASMFRNFLLADRILRGLNCTPMSHPALPSTCDHPLWQAWDLAVETCLSQLMREGVLNVNRPLARPIEKDQDEIDAPEYKKQGGLDGKSNVVMRVKSDSVLTSNNNTSLGMGSLPRRTQVYPKSNSNGSSYNITAPFFAEQLTAFEIWLNFATNRIKEGGVILNPPRKQHENRCGAFDIEAPDQLPVVLQVLLSPAHRVRALILLRRFLNLGPSAVNLALSVGIFPYVLRLLQSQIDEYKHVLVGIWNKILEFDPSCQVDLVKDKALPHFINHLNWGRQHTQDINQGRSNNVNKPSKVFGKVETGHQNTMAAVILAAICSGYPNGQRECMDNNLHGTCCTILQSIEPEHLDKKEGNKEIQGHNEVTSEFRLWLCICIGVMFKDIVTGREIAFRSDVHMRLFSRTRDDSAEVRAAACYALGSLIGPSDRRMIKKPDIDKLDQQLNDNKSFVPEMLSPTPLAYNSNVSQPGFSPLGNLLQRQQLVSTHPQLQPMQQYNNMSYNSTDSGGLGLFSQRQVDQSMLHSMSPPLVQNTSSTPKSVFEDKKSLVRDLMIVGEMISLCDDACPTVRYEATVVLGKAVDRYLMAFVAIANNTTTPKDSDSGISMPDGVDKETENSFAKTWKLMRHLHGNDPHPAVSNAATAILRFVNEHILVLETKFHRIQERRTYSERRLDILEHKTNDNANCIPQKQYLRTNSAMDLGERSMLATNRSKSLRLSSLHEVNESEESERSMSPITPTGIKDDPFASERNNDMDGHIKIDLMNILPSSQFYEWKKKVFEEEEDGDFVSTPDPLSSDGAVRLYREQRNFKIDTNCITFSDSVSILQPKRRRRRNILDAFSSFDIHGDLLDLDDESNDQQLEAEINAKKEALHLQERSLLSNDQDKGTYMLRFHSYESVLASSDGYNCITIWDTVRSVKANRIMNCNPTGTRMTSMCWVNERNNSLLLTGSEDGSVRIFDNAIKNPMDIEEEATLSTAFYAMPELEPIKKGSGSGLITEWQQCSGRLLTGGNTNIIRCWDLESEKCRTKIETDNVSACLTTFETAWDYVHGGGGAEGYSGIGPDIVLGGYSDGIIKVFDLRAYNEQEGTTPTRRRFYRRQKELELSEHTQWIVNICFMNCGSNYEVVSGSTLGDVKFWDLRNLRSPIDTQEVQRTEMTAFVGHPRLPLLATGSHANFIKLFTPDGDVFQVIRNHQGQAGRKIGPVSILAFHPNKPMLAAGTTDEIISIYDASRGRKK
jgi:WD40 repeat protein